MGLCSYYRQYISNFSHIAQPLTQLTKKTVKFNWDQSCQAAFEILKEKLCSAHILACPKPGLKYILDTDASDVGIGAVLSQVQDGKERVIAYASKKLNAQQQRYSVTRRELLAVITFMNHFRHFRHLFWLENFCLEQTMVVSGGFLNSKTLDDKLLDG